MVDKCHKMLPHNIYKKHNNFTGVVGKWEKQQPKIGKSPLDMGKTWWSIMMIFIDQWFTKSSWPSGFVSW